MRIEILFVLPLLVLVFVLYITIAISSKCLKSINELIDICKRIDSELDIAKNKINDLSDWVNNIDITVKSIKELENKNENIRKNW